MNKNINRCFRNLIVWQNSGDFNIEWFEAYDKKNYSLENKLIKLNKTYIQKFKDNKGWKNDYILREQIENYEIE